MADWLLSFAGGDAGEVGVAIETPRGPVVESLMEHGFAVHSINPKQLDRFRDRFSPAGAKDDRRDARVLAAALRTDPHCLRRLEPTDPAIVELREWSRLSEELTRERVRLANRMRQQLWRYYPQFLDAVDDDVAAPWALDLWRSLPTPGAGQRVREVTLTRVLKQHRIRRVDAATLRARLRAPAVKVAAGAAEAAVAHVRLLTERLALVNRQLNDVRRELVRLVRQLAEATPADAADASTEDEPASSTEPPDAAILLSLPGIGTGVLATLLAEASDVVQRRDYDALRCLCGVAPVTRRSGKSLIVTRRLATHERLRDAAYHWARVAAQRDPVSHALAAARGRKGERGCVRKLSAVLCDNGAVHGRHIWPQWIAGQPFGWPARASRRVGRSSHPEGRSANRDRGEPRGSSPPTPPCVRGRTPHASPHFAASDHAENLPIHPLFHEHASERLHQRTYLVTG